MWWNVKHHIHWIFVEGNNTRAKLRNALKSMVSQDCSCHVGVFYVCSWCHLKSSYSWQQFAELWFAMICTQERSGIVVSIQKNNLCTCVVALTKEETLFINVVFCFVCVCVFVDLYGIEEEQWKRIGKIIMKGLFSVERKNKSVCLISFSKEVFFLWFLCVRSVLLWVCV